MTTDETDPWLKKSIWDVSAAVALLLGLKPEVDGHGFVYIDTPPYRPSDPNSIDWNQRMKEIRELAYEDMDAGKLPYLLKRKDRRVAPREFCQWAIWRGYAVPASWRIAFLDDPAPIGQPATESASMEQGEVATTMTANHSQVTKPKRMVAWQAEMLKEWDRIVESHGPQPDVVNVMRWLKRQGPVEVFPRSQDDPFSLVWMDQFGDTHKVQKKTVSNAIAQFRQSGEIPA